MRLRFLPDRTGEDLCRVAYAIPRKAGNAVVRNRIRRRTRAAVDQVAGEMAPGCYLISPSRDTIDMTFPDLTNSLRASLRSAGALQEAMQ